MNWKKILRDAERRERAGWPGLVKLKDIYDFEMFLTRERGWHSAVTQGNELMHVYGYGRELIVWFDASTRRTKVNCRRVMALWYAYDTFHRKDD